MQLRPALIRAVIVLTALIGRESSSAFAQDDYNAPYTKENIAPIGLFLNDDATNGCWTNHKETKTYAEAQLDLAGLELGERPRTNLFVTVLSERSKFGLCYGTVEISLRAFVPWGDGRAFVSLAQQIIPFTGASNANTIVLDQVKTFAVFLASFPETN